MRLLLALLMSVAAFGQEAATQTKPEEKEQAKTEQKTEQKAAEAPAAEAPAAAASEQWLTGSFEFGYRWVGDIRGNPLQYRSVVNLDQGPQLFNMDFTLTDPKKRLFDRIDAFAEGWGGQPSNIAHLQAVKRRLYDLRADYRNIAYFNAVPSFANPFAPGGFNERSFDIRRRNGYVDLQFLPGRHIMPYLVYERNSSNGHGAALWVQDMNNEFPVPTLIQDGTNNYRGGVRVEYNRYHVTLEQGGTTYKDDSSAAFSGANYGDRRTPFLGTTTLQLNQLSEAYHIRGSSIYTRVLASASPTRWADISGQFLFSQPKTDGQYFDTANGTFGLLSQLLVYSGQLTQGTSNANQPHITANAAVELRPLKGFRVIQSFMTNRLHNAGFGALTEQLFLTPNVSQAAITDVLNTRQIVNYNQYQLEGIWDVTPWVALRGGWRREWGDATVRAGQLDPLGPLVMKDMRRDVGLAGITARPIKSLSLNLDYEGGTTATNYFRTSLYNYHRLRVRGRYQIRSSFGIQGSFSLLANENPALDIKYDVQGRSGTFGVYWMPQGGKYVTLNAEYTRSTFNSSINFLLLPFLTPSVSQYRDDGHTGVGTIDVNLPKIGGVAPKLTAGGSLFVSSGSRATSYYQPLGRLSLPLQKHLQWNTEWRYYGFGETAYLYEGFRAHIFQTGVKLIK